MKNFVIIENSKTRGKYQFFWYFSIVFFFLVGVCELFGGIIWFDVSNPVPFVGIIVPAFLLFSALVFFFCFILSLLLTWRYFLLSGDEIVVFTGFGKYKIRCNGRIQIAFVLIGNGVQSTCGCLIFKDKLKVCEYQLCMGNSFSKETQSLIEEKMNCFSSKTQCLVYYKWFVRAEEAMKELGLKNKRIRKKNIND